RAAEVLYWDNNRVLKLFYKDFPGHIIDYQFKVDRLIGNVFPNHCPKAYEKIEENGRIGILYEYIEGVTLMELMQKNKKNIGKVLRKLAEVHVEMHKHEIQDINTLVDFFKLMVRQTNLLDDDQKEKIINHIEKLPEGKKICHGDYHPDNIIISKNNLYILDWSNAYTGNPNSDVARTYYVLKYGTSPYDKKKNFITRFFLNAIRSRFANIYLKHYLELSDTSMEDIKKWDLAIFATRLREPIPLEYDKLLKMIKKLLKHQSNIKDV
ncbi:MAG: aminoglycoside phosphotransferase family protein, partial [Promethearchaeota archaeon]